jgi:hypothetical protein
MRSLLHNNFTYFFVEYYVLENYKNYPNICLDVFTKLRNSMEQSTFWEPNSCSASKELHLLWTQKFIAMLTAHTGPHPEPCESNTYPQHPTSLRPILILTSFSWAFLMVHYKFISLFLIILIKKCFINMFTYMDWEKSWKTLVRIKRMGEYSNWESPKCDRRLLTNTPCYSETLL